MSSDLNLTALAFVPIPKAYGQCSFTLDPLVSAYVDTVHNRLPRQINCTECPNVTLLVFALHVGPSHCGCTSNPPPSLVSSPPASTSTPSPYLTNIHISKQPDTRPISTPSENNKLQVAAVVVLSVHNTRCLPNCCGNACASSLPCSSTTFPLLSRRKVYSILEIGRAHV